ncbi:MAG: hypothetical protein HY601_00875 [Candidatus Omnitrophica bacterium]|nr:hypothetical protein [Candidatus Omnitrophota bacterium]
MVAPMAVLALGALGAGLSGSPWLHNPFFRLLREDGHHAVDWAIFGWSLAVFGLGLWLAWTAGFARRTLLPQALRPLGQRLYDWALHKYYVDELYARLFVAPWVRLGEGLARFDGRVIDRAVDGAGGFGWWVGQAKDWVDRQVVDRLVNAIAVAVRWCGGVLRWIQTGVVHQYLLAAVVAVMLVSLALRR